MVCLLEQTPLTDLIVSDRPVVWLENQLETETQPICWTGCLKMLSIFITSQLLFASSVA